jgi:formylglycine-generating enzyme required for sulfatase activity
VNYVYRIGKFEITAAQYGVFLNAVAATDTYELYNPSMSADDAKGCKIERAGSPGSYTYSVAPEWGDRPVNYISWGDAARFANWLHNGQPTGAQNVTTTEDGSYYLDGATSFEALMAVVRRAGATWVIPSEDEWYKAAYHKNDGVTGNYWDYPTKSNTPPTAEAPPGTDMTNGSANYYSGGYVDPTHYRTEVGAYNGKPSDSSYGTYDQGGNVWEYNEAVLQGSSRRGIRGGSFKGVYTVETLNAACRGFNAPNIEFENVGFRVAYFTDCNDNGILDECDLDCGTPGGPCDVPGCGQSTDANGNGVLDDCAPDIPTVSEWGVVAMTLLVLTAGTVVLTRRRRAVTAR